MIMIVLIVIILAIIGVFLWLYIEEARFTLDRDNFTDQGWSNWRRTLILVLAIIAIILLGLQAIGIIFGLFGNWLVITTV